MVDHPPPTPLPWPQGIEAVRHETTEAPLDEWRVSFNVVGKEAFM